jgi:UDP-N-acetyl-D-glucosamine dehydrogenase
MPEFVVNGLMETLNEHGKTLKAPQHPYTGSSHKKNVDDMRASPAIGNMRLIEKKDETLDYNAPYVSSANTKRVFWSTKH